MVPAESETRESKILLRNFWLSAAVTTPIKDPELIRMVATRTDNNSFGIMVF